MTPSDPLTEEQYEILFGQPAEQPLNGGIAPAVSTGRSPKIWLLSAVAILMIVELGARLIEPSVNVPPVTWYDAATQQRVEMFDAVEPEVVFVGTSMSWQAFVPETFNANSEFERSFNAGLAGAVPTVTSPWVTDIVAERTTPDVVVWGLSSLDFSASYGDGPEQAWLEAPATRSDPLGLVDTFGREFSATLRLRRLLRSPDELWGDGATIRSQEWQDALDVTGADGERLDFTEDKSDRTAAIMSARLKDFRIDAADVAAVERAVNELTAQNIRVVLVELPVPPSFINQHPGGAADHARTGETIELLATALDLEHYDLSTGYEEDDFVDFTHLTADAADRFTAEFAQLLPLEKESP